MHLRFSDTLPDPGRHGQRFYGAYSNRARATISSTDGDSGNSAANTHSEKDNSDFSRKARSTWVRRAAGVAAGWKQSREQGDLLVEEGLCHALDCRVTSACALLLAGAWDEAREAAAKDLVLGWSGIESGQAIVLPFLLVYLSHGATHLQLPNLRALWQ
jgi:hypothetical protein